MCSHEFHDCSSFALTRSYVSSTRVASHTSNCVLATNLFGLSHVLAAPCFTTFAATLSCRYFAIFTVCFYFVCLIESGLHSNTQMHPKTTSLLFFVLRKVWFLFCRIYIQTSDINQPPTPFLVSFLFHVLG